MKIMLLFIVIVVVLVMVVVLVQVLVQVDVLFLLFGVVYCVVEQVFVVYECGDY